MTPKHIQGCVGPVRIRPGHEAGISVWNGRFPGATVFGSPGSIVKPAPRSCSAKPVPGHDDP